MNAGAFIGGVLGLLAGIAFVGLSIYIRASQIDPPPFIVVIFVVVGGAIGYAISEERARRRKAQKNDPEG